MGSDQFGCLAYRGGHGGNFSTKKICSAEMPHPTRQGGYLGVRSWKMSLNTLLIEPELSQLPCRDSAVVTRRRHAISAVISKPGFFDLQTLIT